MKSNIDDSIVIGQSVAFSVEGDNVTVYINSFVDELVYEQDELKSIIVCDYVESIEDDFEEILWRINIDDGTVEANHQNDDGFEESGFLVEFNFDTALSSKIKC